MTEQAGDEQPHGDKPTTTFEDTMRAVGADVADVLDSAVDHTAKFIGGENGSKLVGGAVVGALAAIVLPFSIVTGVLMGAGYAAYRKMKR